MTTFTPEITILERVTEKTTRDSRLHADELFNEYRKCNRYFTEPWRKHIREVLAQQGDSDQAQPFNTKIQAQLDRMSKAAQVEFTPIQQALYQDLRLAAHLPEDIENVRGVRPQELTDEQLMIEICIITSHSDMARALVAQYPSTRLKD